MDNKKKATIISIIIVIILIIGAILALNLANKQSTNNIDIATLESNENIKVVYDEESKIPTLITGKYTSLKVNDENEAIMAI